jgi:uncharacterized protein YndB with AHSA1/START domain
MRLGLTAAWLLGALALVLIVYLRTRPATIRVTRSAIINAPRERVFALLEDFHNWPQWAPQDREDPRMRRSYSGAARGVGAQSAWESRGRGGSGRMQVTRAVPPSLVEVEVDFSRPFSAHNLNTFTLDTHAGATTVTWSMQGTNALLLRLMGIFVSPDRLLGGHFERGLTDLAAAAERAPHPP